MDWLYLAMRIYRRAASPFAACRARCTRGANAPMQYVVSPCRRWPELEAPKKLAVQHARAGGCQCVVVLTECTLAPLAPGGVAAGQRHSVAH
jgi:hypothetical protein